MLNHQAPTVSRRERGRGGEWWHLGFRQALAALATELGCFLCVHLLAALHHLHYDVSLRTYHGDQGLRYTCRAKALITEKTAAGGANPSRRSFCAKRLSDVGEQGVLQ